MPEGDPRREGLKLRTRALLRRHGRTWLAPLRGEATQCRFRRGFVQRVTVPAHVVIAGVDGFRRAEPVAAVFVTVATDVIERVPESVARENVLLPLLADEGRLWIAMSDINDRDTIQKLQFILNRDITPVALWEVEIREGIERHYGPADTEAVETPHLLGEFVCTAFDPDDLPDAPPAEWDSGAAVRLLYVIIAEGAARGADAILILPDGDQFQVRYRIAGG